jgi:hypothetical protein
LVGQAFKREIEQNMVPSKGREIRVEIMEGSWDWQEFLAPLNINLSGVAITAEEKSVVHSFRVVRRGDLKTYKGSELWTVATEVKDSCNVAHAPVGDLRATLHMPHGWGSDTSVVISTKCK